MIRIYDDVRPYKIEGIRDFWGRGWVEEQEINEDPRSDLSEFSRRDPNNSPFCSYDGSRVDLDYILEEDDPDLQEELEEEAIRYISYALDISYEDAQEIWEKQKEHELGLTTP